MVTSLRLDPKLAEETRRAARLRGMSPSTYMREAIAERVRTDLERSTPTLWERTRDLIEGTPEAGPRSTVARRHHDEYGRLLSERYEQAKRRRSPRGPAG
jgi:hypothetical protein